MKRIVLPLILVFCLFLLPAAYAAAQWTVYFSPNGGCTDAVVKEIGKAKTSILAQAYSFTSAPIAKALVDAHKRGNQGPSHLGQKQSNGYILFG